MNRRTFIKNTSKTTLGMGLALSFPTYGMPKEKELFFKISLAQWSLHRSLRTGKLTTMDFPAKAKNDFGIHAVEYVNQFFLDKAKNRTFLKALKQRTLDLNINNVLIMIDGEGDLGSTTKRPRSQAVENHYKWVEAAQSLGCHAIRVNAKGKGNKVEVAKAVTEGLHQLSSFAKAYAIDIIVENHGGYSSNGDWLSGIMKNVNLANCGTSVSYTHLTLPTKA